MKKFVLLAMLGLFLAGCGASAKQSEFWQHDAIYKNWDHLKFSWTGGNNATQEIAQKSQEQEWWGIEVPYIPAQ
jgi:hypothetical protein